MLVKRPDIKLVVGASKIKYDGWILTEIDFLNILKDEDWQYALKKNTVSAILAEHVWEHLYEKDGLLGAKNCFQYLKPGGHMRVAVPDGFHPDKEYIEYVRPGGHGAGADDHKVLYNYKSFGKLFEDAGFTVKFLEYFDENGKFHYQEWSPDDGMIVRSKRYDDRNADGTLRYTSLIVDAVKK
ncbi:MAG: hypothetical protein HOP08_07740 [Cyclobacteriaceae bacterium]|nr:hypothetical protein [Cyclobacteriaceae bacterium]